MTSPEERGPVRMVSGRYSSLSSAFRYGVMPGSSTLAT